MHNLTKVRDSISELAVAVMDNYKNRRLQLYKHSSVEIAGKPKGLTSLYMRAGWYHVGGTQLGYRYIIRSNRIKLSTQRNVRYYPRKHVN